MPYHATDHEIVSTAFITGNVKFTLEQATIAQRESRSVALLFL